MTKLALDFPIYMIGPISHVFLRFYKLLDLAQFDLTMPNLSKVWNTKTAVAMQTAIWRNTTKRPSFWEKKFTDGVAVSLTDWQLTLPNLCLAETLDVQISGLIYLSTMFLLMYHFLTAKLTLNSTLMKLVRQRESLTMYHYCDCWISTIGYFWGPPRFGKMSRYLGFQIEL